MQHVFISEDEYMSHSLTGLSRKVHKYILRIKNGTKYRYFYSKAEIDAWIKKVKQQKREKDDARAAQKAQEEAQKKEEQEIRDGRNEREAYVQAQRNAAMAAQAQRDNDAAAARAREKEEQAKAARLRAVSDNWFGSNSDIVKAAKAAEKETAEERKRLEARAKTSREGAAGDLVRLDIAESAYSKTKMGKEASSALKKQQRDNAKLDRSRRKQEEKYEKSISKLQKKSSRETDATSKAKIDYVVKEAEKRLQELSTLNGKNQKTADRRQAIQGELELLLAIANGY